jgi:hypothetical protein
LREIQTRGGVLNFYPKEIVQQSKIFKRKSGLKELNAVSYSLRIGSSDDDIIHVNKNNDDMAMIVRNKQ